MKPILPVLLFLCAGLAVTSLPASAQSPDEDLAAARAAVTQTPSGQTGGLETDDPDMAAMVKKVKIITRSKNATELPENTPIALDLGLVDVPGADSKLTEGVTAKAYARYVKVEEQKVGQLVLSGVEKDGRAEALNSDDFVAQFALENDPKLDPAAPITIEGDQSELIAALKRLAVAGDEETASKKEVEEAGIGASDGAVASNAASNPDAGSYTTPGALELDDTPQTSTRITAEGCKMRIDLDQLQAIQQTRMATTTDGETSYGTCADGEERYKINKSYNACSYIEDLDARTATASFIYYYTDGSGNRVEHGDCQPDPEARFDIVEDSEACRVTLDYDAGSVITNAKLVYTNQSGRKVEVRDCRPSEQIAPAPMTATAEGCDIRDDFNAGVSYQRHKYIYELNGVSYSTACTDSGTEYKHQTIYKSDSGDYVCTPLINSKDKSVTLQSRVRILVNGLEQFRTACTPDTTSMEVMATTEGCEDPAYWTHSMSAGQSYGSERYYYFYDDKQEFITDCQKSDQVYTHQVEITGWQPHDDQLFGYALSTVYIDGTPQGRYNIKTSEVLPGTAQTPYTYDGESTEPTSEITYEDCTKFQGQNLVKNYTRPDGTKYSLVAGEADPVNMGNACTAQISWASETHATYVVPTQYNFAGTVCGTTTLSYNFTDTGKEHNSYSGQVTAPNHCAFTDAVATKNIVREDGEIIGEAESHSCRATATAPSIRNYYNNGTQVQYQGFGPAYPTLTTAIRSQCIVNWGWPL